MNKLLAVMFSALIGASSFANAAIDETIRVKETIEINAPADQVWAIVGNFGDLGRWHPAIAKTDITSGKAAEVGATRVLTLQDGGKTTVLWKSMFKRQDPANPPAAGKDDKTARDTITQIFKTGLENLKKISEK